MLAIIWIFEFRKLLRLCIRLIFWITSYGIECSWSEHSNIRIWIPPQNIGLWMWCSNIQKNTTIYIKRCQLTINLSSGKPVWMIWWILNTSCYPPRRMIFSRVSMDASLGSDWNWWKVGWNWSKKFENRWIWISIVWGKTMPNSVNKLSKTLPWWDYRIWWKFTIFTPIFQPYLQNLSTRCRNKLRGNFRKNQRV